MQFICHFIPFRDSRLFNINVWKLKIRLNHEDRRLSVCDNTQQHRLEQTFQRTYSLSHRGKTGKLRGLFTFPHYGVNRFLWNVGKYLSEPASHPRRKQSTLSTPWELQISHITQISFSDPPAHTTQYVSIRIQSAIMYREIISVYSDSHRQHINIYLVQNAELPDVQAGGALRSYSTVL